MQHATVHMHQATGAAADIAIAANEIIRNNEVIRRILAKHTGQTPERIRQDTDRDFFLSAEEAKAYGLIDAVISPPGAETAGDE